MQDKQNKGIGRYKDRPGYFWGGVVGGAILGALVNKMQGKDWKRGAIYGGISGGIGSAFVGKGATTAAGTGWVDKMAPGITKSMFTMGAGNPALFGSTVGAAGAWMAGDPKKDRSDYEAWMEEEEAKRRKKQIEAYKYWHTNPWATGGAVNARPGYYNGGGAWSGVESDEEVPGSYEDKVLSITGQGGVEGQGGLEDILESLEMSSGPGQGDLSGWHDMYLDLKGKGEIPGDWDFNDFMENLGALDISPTDFAQADPQTLGRFPLVGGSNADAQTQGRFPLVGGEMAAEGGYKTRPKYQGGGMTDAEKKAYQGLLDSGYTEDEAIKIIELHGSDYGGLQVPDFLKSQAGDAQGGYKTRPGYRHAGPVIDEEERNPFEMRLFGKKMLGVRGLLWKMGLLNPDSELIEKLTRGGREVEDEMFGYMDTDKPVPVGESIPISEEEYRNWQKMSSERHKGHPMGSRQDDLYNELYRAQGGRVKMVGGGIGDLDMTSGGASNGPGTGTSDDIPAMLSDGEFVVTANAVKNLGGGDRMLGAKKMYSMMNQLDPDSQTPAEMNTVGMA